MTAYLISSCRILEAASYRLYAEAAKDLSAPHGGELAAIGHVSECLEGLGEPGERVVVTRFPDAASARRFYNSAAYQAARELRAACADRVSIRLVE
jgi:uncharacterized protein (DUF1330 family)